MAGSRGHRDASRGIARALLTAACALALALALCPGAAIADDNAAGDAYAPTEILIEFEGDAVAGASTYSVMSSNGAAVDGLDAKCPDSEGAADSTEAVIEQVESAADVAVVEVVAEADAAGGTVVLAEITDGSTPEEAAAKAMEAPGVAFAQPNYCYRLLDEGWDEDANALESSSGRSAMSSTADLNDPYANMLWHLNSWDSAHGASVTDAWDLVKCEGGATVAIFDTGVLATHEDLAGNVLLQFAIDIPAGTDAGVITDSTGHGTHVAGIVAAMANNARGVAGATYNAKIIPIKVFDSSGNAHTSSLIAAYRYLFGLIDVGKVQNLHVVNMSLGGYGSEEGDDILQALIAQAANDYDIVTVCSGGNGSKTGEPRTDPCYPADFDECISVTSLTQSGTNVHRADYNLAKDISAPGANIYSTYGTASNEYKMQSGTSMASPIVAGVAALLWAVDPDLTVDQAKEALYATANPLDPNGTDYHSPDETGSVGCVDAAAAVAYVVEHSGEYAGGTVLRRSWVQPVPDQTYTGRALEPAVSVVRDGVELVEGQDFTVAYYDNVAAGQGRVVITGAGEYTGTVTVSFTILKNGWERVDGSWYYYRAGAAAVDWNKIDGTWYWFDSAGVMATGWLELDGTWYYLGGNGKMRTGWLELGSKTYYLNASGAMAVGWKKLDDAWYYFRPSGAMAVGWQKVNETWYYLDDDGTMRTGWLELGGKTYYLNASGAMAVGWKKLDGSWYYFNPGGSMATGWKKVDGTWYFLKSNGVMLTGWLKDGGSYYYLKASGAMAIGWLKVDGSWYYFKQSGKMASSEYVDGYWLAANGKWTK